MLEYLSNGLGAPSMMMLILAVERKIPARLSITADTGSENYRPCSDGRIVSARQYFDEVVVPLAKSGGVESVFVRARRKDGSEMPPLFDHTEMHMVPGKDGNLKVPMFGSRGGRLGQSCTQRWKMTAIKQELRRRTSKGSVVRGAYGLHRHEFVRRFRGADQRIDDGVTHWSWMEGKSVVRWQRFYCPLAVEFPMSRAEIRAEMERRGIPYLLSSECDMCPHKDRARWLRTPQHIIDRCAAMEKATGGKWFFDQSLQPIDRIVAEWRKQGELFEDLDFGCGNMSCGF